MTIKKLFNRRIAGVLAWAFTILFTAIVINALGIRLLGSVNGWHRWLASHAQCFMAWRLCLYAATAYGWWWMRGRVRQREPSPETHRRLLRTEIAAVMVVLALEGTLLLTAP